MNPEETKRWIWSRCTECGDCLIWNGAVDDAGVPQMRIPGIRKVLPARRVLMTALGRKIDGLIATTRCDNKRCMAEEHVVAWTRKMLQKRSGKKYAGSADRAVKLMKANEQRSRLGMETARDIRAKGMTAQEVMEQYGVSKSSAYDVIAGRHWKDYSSPFAGLMR